MGHFGIHVFPVFIFDIGKRIFLGFGKSCRKVSGHECFFEEIIYKNKSKGADTIIFQNVPEFNKTAFFNRSSDGPSRPWRPDHGSDQILSIPTL